jgi:tape measure domain-containing protein
MTTINSYSVSLALDASSYIRNSSLSRKETQQLVREINSARTPADNYTRSLKLIDKAVKDGAISQATYNRLLDSAKTKFSGAASAAKGFGSSIGSAIVGMAGAVSLKALISDSVKIAAEAETASIAFEVLTGSVQESAEMVAGLRQLAAVSPLSIRDTQQAAKTMLSFGVASESILPTLKMLGDVTGGNSDRFKFMSLAFAQVRAAGRLMGQDLLQMINAGFNPLQEISKQTGESMVELKKRMEAGAISAEEVAAALKSATSEGGLFFGMIDRMATTTEGKSAILKDQVFGFKKALGEAVLQSQEFEGGMSSANYYMQLLRQGMEVVAGGGAANIKGDTQTALEKIRQQQFFADRQMRLRREGKETFLSEENKARAQQITDPDGGSLSGTIESAITTGIESLKTGTGGLLDAMKTFQDVAVGVTSAGMAQTQELVKELKDDPAVANLQVGTQQAYEYLTQASRDLEKQARLEAVRKQQLEENAKAQRDKMTQQLERINQALENNGWKRIR